MTTRELIEAVPEKAQTEMILSHEFVLASDYDALRAAALAFTEPFVAMLDAGGAYLDEWPDDREVFAINGKAMTVGDLRSARALRERIKP